MDNNLKVIILAAGKGTRMKKMYKSSRGAGIRKNQNKK